MLCLLWTISTVLVLHARFGGEILSFLWMLRPQINTTPVGDVSVLTWELSRFTRSMCCVAVLPSPLHFLKVIESMSSEDQSGFVRFAWGRSRLPPKAYWRVNMKLLRSNMSEESLPVGVVWCGALYSRIACCMIQHYNLNTKLPREVVVPFYPETEYFCSTIAVKSINATNQS